MEIYEVTKDQYDHIVKYYSGRVFHKKKDGKYLIKTYPGTKKRIEKSLNVELILGSDE